MWTSGLQLRKRKRPNNEKDSFVSKKRRLLDTTNKIVAFKEAKRKEALKKEADRVVRVAARTSSSQAEPVSVEKTTRAPQIVTTSTTTLVAVPAAQMQTAVTTSCATLLKSTAPQTAQSTTITTATKPAQNLVSVQRGASLTSSTQGPITALRMVQPVTTVACTTPAKTPVTLQNDAMSTSSTSVQSAGPQKGQATTTTTVTPVTAESGVTSTCATLAQPSEQNVSKQTLAPSFPSLNTSSTSMLKAAVSSKMSPNLSKVVSQTDSLKISSHQPSVSLLSIREPVSSPTSSEETTSSLSQEASSSLQTPFSSLTHPSSTLPSEMPSSVLQTNGQIPSSTTSSTPLVVSCNSLDLAQSLSTSSAQGSQTINSPSECPTLPQPSTSTNRVSTEAAVEASPVPPTAILRDSSPSLDSSPSPSVLNIAGDHDNHHQSLGDDRKPNALMPEKITHSQDHVTNSTKQDNALSNLESQGITHESSCSVKDSDTFSNKTGHGMSDQGRTEDKLCAFENKPVDTTQGTEVSSTDSVDVPHEQESIDIARENMRNGAENLAGQKGVPLKTMDHHSTKEVQMEDTVGQMQSLEDSGSVEGQEKTSVKSNLSCHEVSSTNDDLLDCQKGHSASSEEFVSKKEQIKDFKKELPAIEKTAGVCFSNNETICGSEMLPASQTSDVLANELLSQDNDAKDFKEGDGSLNVTEKKTDDKLDLKTAIEGSLEDSDVNFSDIPAHEEVGFAASNDLMVNKEDNLSHSDSSKPYTTCKLHEESLLDNDITTSVSESRVKIAKVPSETSCSELTRAIEMESTIPLDRARKSKQTSRETEASEGNISQTDPEQSTMRNDHSASTGNESSDVIDTNATTCHAATVSQGTNESQSSKNADENSSINSKTSSNSTEIGNADPEKSCISTEEPMDVDATNPSSKHISCKASLSQSSTCNTKEQPMDIDVTTASSSETAPLTSIALSKNTGPGSQSASSIEKSTNSSSSTSQESSVQNDIGAKTNIESLSGTVTTDMCSTAALPSASLPLSSGPAKTETTGEQLPEKRTQVSCPLPSTTTSVLPTTSPPVSKSQQPQVLVSAVTPASHCPSPVTPVASTLQPAAVVSVKTTTSLSTQPAASTESSSTASVSRRVVLGGSQGIAMGQSPVVPSAQSVPVKVVAASPTVLTTTVTRGIAPQKTAITVRPQGQASHYIPIGPKPILPSPRPPGVATGVQGSSVVRISTQPAAASRQQTNLAPVNSIAALVASIPTSGATIGPTQLIKLVTPDGKTLTLQGSQLAAIAQQAASPMGLAVPKTITVQVATTAVQQNSPATVQKTIGVKTPGASITVQRTQPQVALAKPQVVITAKAPPSKLVKEEKFPSLEPLTKDPRVLLNRRLAKWPLRHSVKSVFALRKHERRKLGRKAGMKEVSGFSYTSRGVVKHWPAGIPRPSFKVAWRFRTQSLKTLAGAGLQLRILQSCLKWEEMNIRPPRGNSNTVYTSSGECY